MARQPRKKSISGIYHVMLRGINKQTIFEDVQDRTKFLQILKYVKAKSGIIIYGYCLMDNHTHLLVKEKEESISKAIQRLAASYVRWYNQKYERSGHLFQGRFRSEIVESVHSFLKVLRYIHQNPVKAGIAVDVLNCNWTSMKEYLGKSSLVDTESTILLFAHERNKALTLFTNFMLLENNDEFMDVSENDKVSDQEVVEYLRFLGVTSISQLQQMDRVDRDAIIRELKKLRGVSIRQLARVTGISRSVIDRAK